MYTYIFELTGESILLQSCYSGKQTFGATDYKDHREDTLSMLKNKILPLKIFQLGHFYDSNGEQVDTLVLSGYHGGYTGTFLYKSGKNAFNR